MKRITSLAFILILTISLAGQTLKISEKLVLTKLTDKTYIHTCENSNGLVFINKGKALIVSTPDSDIETQNLIDWVINEKNAKIIGYIIDRWHPDAMEGLDIVHKNGITTYSYELTRKIAEEKDLPIPQIGFDPKTEIQVGNEKIICHFLGEAHTKDGIVVWVPSEKILFGGNEIRNFNGWVGNISDAQLDKWAETITNVKKEYGNAKIVIPGHGQYGGPELIDYTIKLYEPCKSICISNRPDTTLEEIYKTAEDFHIIAESDSVQNGNRILRNAVIVAQDSGKYVRIESPQIIYQAERGRIDSETGNLKIYDKKPNGELLRTDVNYKRLIVYKQYDSVGLLVILREIKE